MNEWRQAAVGIKVALKDLLDHVHENYSEIDLDETDRAAWKENLPYIRGDHFKFDDEGDSTPSQKAEANP